MTWIPCPRCHRFPCTCRWAHHLTTPVRQPTEYGWHEFIPNPPPPSQPPQKLSDADIDRIAEKVAEKLRPKRKKR